MSKADRAKRRAQRQAARRAGAPEVAAVPKRQAQPQASPSPKEKAVRPTPERRAKGEIRTPRGSGSQYQPAVVIVPDCVAALCLEPRKLTQGQENAARYYQELRWRVRVDLGLNEGRSCLDIGPVGYDDGEGDVALAAEWRGLRERVGLSAINALDATLMEGRWPRDLPKLRAALDRIEGC